MKPVITYLDAWNRQMTLTEDELIWFNAQVAKARKATGCTVDIIPYDHELYHDKSVDALGCCITTNPKDQLGAGVNTYITIDCFYINECWRHETKGDYLLSEPMDETLAHEIAHTYVWNHGKKHKAMTEKLLQLIRAA